MKNKILTLLVISVVSLGVLVGCGSSAKQSETSQESSTYQKPEPTPYELNNFKSLVPDPQIFEASLSELKSWVKQNNYSEIPTTNHSYAFNELEAADSVWGQMIDQALDTAFNDDRKSYYLDYSNLGELQRIIIRYNSKENIGAQVEQAFGPAVDGEYLGHIGNTNLTLVVYKETLNDQEAWEISIATDH